MRAVVDHHVDRPGMQARQRVQSTGTNRSRGLIRTRRRGTRGPARQPAGRCRDLERPPPSRLQPDPCSRSPDLQAAGAAAACPRLEGLVVTARGKHPIPFRTRPLSPVAPMVLRLKTRESRSPPDQRSPPFLSLHAPQGSPPQIAPRDRAPRHDPAAPEKQASPAQRPSPAGPRTHTCRGVEQSGSSSGS